MTPDNPMTATECVRRWEEFKAENAKKPTPELDAYLAQFLEPIIKALKDNK